MSRTHKSGVYAIRHLPTDQAYVGSSKDIVGRYTWHRHALRNLYHGSPMLQKLWREGHETDFSFEVLELCEHEDLRSCEQKWERVFEGRLLNGRTVTGFQHTIDTRIKQSEGRARYLERKIA